MAVRSGAGTGVIVSLVVFVLTTVFLLVLTIVFYAGKTDALEQSAKADAALAQYVKPQQRNSDQFKGFEQAAGGQSVAGYLNRRYEDLMRYVHGDATVDLERLKVDLVRQGVGEGDVVRQVLEQQRRDQRNAEVEIDGLKGKLAERDGELAEKQAQIDAMTEQHTQALEQVSQNVVSYGDTVKEYQSMVQKTVDELNVAMDRQRDEYEGRVSDLEDELDDRGQELVLLRSRVDEYEAILNEFRIKSRDPAQLVDARVIDMDTTNDQVFIDRGRDDRIVLGMTFEVYDNAAAIRIDERTGAQPRGKASLQVVKVDRNTSTCKITRGVRGRPVVRNDVVANAVYDPAYRFKFLVHGKFDVDLDGRPSEAEAEHLRALVVQWGGEIVLGEELPGDLDFLVLGAQPPHPAPLRHDANQAQIEIWARQRAARQQYDDLFGQASEAQIPVLNASRFFILIGHSDR